MNRKKFILLTLCFSLTASLLCACGTPANSQTESSKETAAPANENSSEKNASAKDAQTDKESENAETETVITEDTETETVITEDAETETADTEDAETETVDTEDAETETVDTEFVNIDTEIDETEAKSVLDERLSTIKDQVIASLPTGNGDWSFYICDLSQDHEDYYADKSMKAASLIKLYIMGAVYEDYDNLIAAYGQDTIDNNLYNMITVSDNDCANNLTSCLGYGDSSQGMSVVNQFCSEHGFTETHMGRLLLASNEYDDNYTSVSDCGHLLKAIRNNDTAEYPHAEDMFNLLAQQQRRHKIPSQLPEGVSVANKTGELDNVENDAGIIYNVENELVVVFMSENLTEVGNAQYAIGSLSNMIYSYYNN